MKHVEASFLISSVVLLVPSGSLLYYLVQTLAWPPEYLRVEYVPVPVLGVAVDRPRCLGHFLKSFIGEAYIKLVSNFVGECYVGIVDMGFWQVYRIRR